MFLARVVFPSVLGAVTGCGAAPAPLQGTDDAGTSALDAAEAAKEDAPNETAAPGDDAPSDMAARALVVVPVAFTEENAPMRILQNGDDVELLAAPQGGHVSLIAAQVGNMSTAAATIRVRMRRPETGFIVAEEKRTVAMVPVPGEGGIMQPDLRSRSQVAHVPLCPNYDPIDVLGRPLDVEIDVTALYTDPPRSGSARLSLVPSCGQMSPAERAFCRCECEANYTLGKCPTDAGRP